MSIPVVCQYQGVLNVPFFNTPYTVANPYGAGVFMALQENSENPYSMDTTGYGNSWDQNMPYVYAQGAGVLLTPQLPYTLSQGAPPTTTAYEGGGTLYMDNQLVYASFGGSSGYPTGSQSRTVSFSALPWFANRVLKTPVSVNPYQTVVVPTPNYGSARRGPFRTFVNYGITTQLTKGLSAWWRDGVTGNAFWCFVDPTKYLTRFGQQNPPYANGVQGFSDYAYMVQCPDVRNSQNTALAWTSGGALKFFTYTVNMNTSQAQFSPSDFVLSFNGPNPLAPACIAHSMANGFLLNNNNQGLECFMSADCSQYWQLNYVAGAAGVRVPLTNNQMVSAQNGWTQRMIDKNGVMWDTAQAGAVVQPVFSLAFNIPFALATMPAVPPLKIPCWNPCCGTDIGLDRIAAGESSVLAV